MNCVNNTPVNTTDVLITSSNIENTYETVEI